MAFRSFIDPPSSFAPLEEWRAFLEQVKALPQDDDAVKLAREEAERHIAELELESQGRAAT